MAASVETARRLTLAWGIHSIEVPAISSLDEMSTFACETALKEGFAAKGNIIVVAAGTPVGVSGTTNMLKILSV
jgi:pyruvate kinase